ncbi:fimbrial protein [Providencia sp. Me31A]|uniref:fimbrial protein n=1 Tax=Providencia sp. Me31A TaxID=3392637 RepID=UPI003D2D00C2
MHKAITPYYWLYLLMLASIAGYANPQVQVYEYTIKVNVQTRTCDISSTTGSNMITVDFDTISKQGILNNQYERTIPYRIRCSANSSLKIKIQGDGTSFNTNLLKVKDNADLGFQFKYNNSIFNINTLSSSFMSSSPPILKVSPKIAPSKENTIKGGDFNSSTANIIIEYS